MSSSISCWILHAQKRQATSCCSSHMVCHVLQEIVEKNASVRAAGRRIAASQRSIANVQAMRSSADSTNSASGTTISSMSPCDRNGLPPAQSLHPPDHQASVHAAGCSNRTSAAAKVFGAPRKLLRRAKRAVSSIGSRDNAGVSCTKQTAPNIADCASSAQRCTAMQMSSKHAVSKQGFFARQLAKTSCFGLPCTSS